MSDNPKMPRTVTLELPKEGITAPTEYTLKSQADALANALKACMKQVNGCCGCLALTVQRKKRKPSPPLRIMRGVE